MTPAWSAEAAEILTHSQRICNRDGEHGPTVWGQEFFSAPLSWPEVWVAGLLALIMSITVHIKNTDLLTWMQMSKHHATGSTIMIIYIFGKGIHSPFYLAVRQNRGLSLQRNWRKKSVFYHTKTVLKERTEKIWPVRRTHLFEQQSQIWTDFFLPIQQISEQPDPSSREKMEAGSFLIIRIHWAIS